MTEPARPEPDCDPQSLRALGIEQGCRITVELELQHADVDDTGTVGEHSVAHREWVVAAQDCDLAWSMLVTDPQPQVELRPVHDAGRSDWGVRSHTFRFDENGTLTDNRHPRKHVTPAVLAAAHHDHRRCCTDEHARRFKTWLGLRYDRPSIPQSCAELARALAKTVSAKKRRTDVATWRDVLVAFYEGDGPVQYQVVAILDDSAVQEDLEAAERLLAEAASEVPVGLGVASDLLAYRADGISLEFIERSYSVDVSAVSWPLGAPGPIGSTPS